jgi:molybdate transport system substrate-binding protein
MQRPPCRDFFGVGSLRFLFTGFFLATAAIATTHEIPVVAQPPGDATAHTESHLAIAAAANLVYVMEDLNAAFQSQQPGVVLTVTMGASGNLVAQIRHGAPFDVFLSADLEHPKSLVERGEADAKSLRTFAIGRLVLWTTKPSIELESFASTMKNPTVRRIALANTETAPYGVAAKQALERSGVAEEVRGKLVFGENITQTAQFVETGNADVGLVALSLVLSPSLKNRGRWIPVPEELYTPIEQGAVLTRRGASNPAAVQYLEFLQSNEAREIMKRFGYPIPK